MSLSTMHHIWAGYTVLLVALGMSGVNSQCLADADSFDFVGLRPPSTCHVPRNLTLL